MNKNDLVKSRDRLSAFLHLSPALARVSRLERWTMIIIAATAAALFAFAKLGEEMVEVTRAPSTNMCCFRFELLGILRIRSGRAG